MSLFLRGTWINAATIELGLVPSSTQVLLNFTDQKNGNRNEPVTHGPSGHPLLCPLRAVQRRVSHLRSHGAAPSTPLYRSYTAAGFKDVTSGALTNLLRSSCSSLGPSLGLRSSDISAQALRAGGAMALLRAGIPDSVIRLVGRWRSWAMLEYLHLKAAPTHHLAPQMLTGGRFTITSHSTLPADALLLIQKVPPAAAAASSPGDAVGCNGDLPVLLDGHGT